MGENLREMLDDINQARRAGTFGSNHPKNKLVETEFQASNKLYVYGTLGPDQPNEKLLRDIGGKWRKATTTGRLQKTDPKQGIHYPFLYLNPNEPAVNGHVFFSKNLAKNWPKLDAFEGSCYIRLLTIVQYADGSNDVANVYAAQTG